MLVFTDSQSKLGINAL
jgi:hypothetical protein